MKNSTKIEEMQLGLQAITMSLIVDTKKDVHKELNLRIPETRIDIQATKTIVETTRRGLETRLAGVHD